jgi:2-isopropylmalate synthase
MNLEKIVIFDTTLRDGEQSPGASMSVEEKLAIAHQLERLGVDIIEAGFPVSSPTQFEACRIISAEIQKATIASLARTIEKDIEACAKSMAGGKNIRIHTFIATSAIHMEYKLKKSPSEVLVMAERGVKLARAITPNVEFSCEDATRSDRNFMREILEAVIEAGATTLNIPDTVGYTIPSEYYDLIKFLKGNVKGIDKCIISVHCHNDLGLAVANSLSAIAAGARQVECTVNGIGERAGNAALEEIVMTLKVRQDQFQADTNVNTREIARTSRLFSSITGIQVQPNKAIVGANAFSHESGIHQDGVLKNSSTYEIMSPETIGLDKNKLVLGRHSGRHGFKSRMEELGYNLTNEELELAFEKFLQIADKKKEIFEEDLLALLEDSRISKLAEKYKLSYLHTSSGNRVIPMATVELEFDGGKVLEASTGDGPVDAIYKAVEKIINKKTRLVRYSLNAITEGKDAMGEVNVIVELEGEKYIGKGISTDIIEASAKAYLNAINKFAALKQK